MDCVEEQEDVEEDEKEEQGSHPKTRNYKPKNIKWTKLTNDDPRCEKTQLKNHIVDDLLEPLHLAAKQLILRLNGMVLEMEAGCAT